MEVGMMPAKLALSLINIAVGEYEKISKTVGQSDSQTVNENCHTVKLSNSITIWDPFV